MTRKKALVRTSPAVLVEGGDLYTTTLLIAQFFKMAHKNVLQAIDSLNVGEEFSRLNFQPRNYVDSRGKDQRMFRVSQEGFMRIAFRFNSKRLGPIQDWFCTEFFRMRRYLDRTVRRNASAEWMVARKEITDGRRLMTDTVKLFVEYAKAQGSGKPEMYYLNLTKAEYKALFILEEETGVPLRDRLNVRQLGVLKIAEEIVDRALKDGMDLGLHYKAIFVLAKERIESYASLIGKSRVDDTGDDNRPMLGI